MASSYSTNFTNHTQSLHRMCTHQPTVITVSGLKSFLMPRLWSMPGIMTIWAELCK